MEKIRVTFEQLIAVSLMGFDDVDIYDLSIYAKGIQEFDKRVEYISEPIKEIRKIITISNGVISLRDDEDLIDVYGCFDDLKLLGSVTADIIKKYLNGLDMEIFVLKKINHLGAIPTNLIEHTFNNKQFEALANIFLKGFVDVRWNDNCLPDDYEELFVTKSGLVLLYLEDNKDVVNDFKRLLNEQKYDDSLLFDFLLTQELSEDPNALLTLDNFKTFCSKYDRCLTKTENNGEKK